MVRGKHLLGAISHSVCPWQAGTGESSQQRLSCAQCLLKEAPRKNQDLWDEHLLMPRAILQPPPGSKPAAATHKGGFFLRKLLLQGMDPIRCPKHSSALPMSHAASLPRASVSPPASLVLVPKETVIPLHGAQRAQCPAQASPHGVPVRKAEAHPSSGQETQRAPAAVFPVDASAARRARGSGGSKLDEESRALMGSFPMHHTHG